jgi:hypothetical protein
LYGTERLKLWFFISYLEEPLQQAPTSFLALISRALRAKYENVGKEPLPQRWVDLIHHLNERERAETHQSEAPSKPRRCIDIRRGSLLL